MSEFLMKLINASGPSGFEKPIRHMIEKEIKKYVDEVKVDKFGNLIAHHKGKSPAVMLVAHMDEVGLMVRSISEGGWIYCEEVGGLEPITLMGEHVKIPTKKGFIRGIITTKEITGEEEMTQVPKMHDLIVDTGLTKKELKKLGVSIGEYMHIDAEAAYLGNNDIICGKALDDRLGCFILIELAKRLQKSKADLMFVFTVQEEVGLYGSKTSMYSINPDWALVVETTGCDDFDMDKYTKKLGGGPCITVKDADMIGNKCINDLFKEISRKKKIPIQLEVTDLGTTDALSISVAKGGIPTGVISIPIRNIHTTTSIAHRRDINHAIEIMNELLKNPPVLCIE